MGFPTSVVTKRVGYNSRRFPGDYLPLEKYFALAAIVDTRNNAIFMRYVFRRHEVSKKQKGKIRAWGFYITISVRL